MSKYKLTNNTRTVRGVTLYRIQAESDFQDVHAGDFGGWIECVENLALNGNAWVWDHATVQGGARLFENAQARECADISGRTQIFGNAVIRDSAQVKDEAIISGNALITGRAQIEGRPSIFQQATIGEGARVKDRARIFGNARVMGGSCVEDDANIYDDAGVFGTAHIRDRAKVYGKSRVIENACIGNDIELCEGIWSESPLCISCESWSLNVASAAQVRIHGVLHSWSEWKDIFTKALQGGQPIEEEQSLREVVRCFNLACEFYNHDDCMVV